MGIDWFSTHLQGDIWLLHASPMVHPCSICANFSYMHVAYIFSHAVPGVAVAITHLHVSFTAMTHLLLCTASYYNFAFPRILWAYKGLHHVVRSRMIVIYIPKPTTLLLPFMFGLVRSIPQGWKNSNADWEALGN